MKIGNFDTKTLLIYMAVSIITVAAIALVRVLVKSGILRRAAKWFTDTHTGNFVRRLFAVSFFIAVVLFIGYFIYTGTKI